MPALVSRLIQSTLYTVVKHDMVLDTSIEIICFCCVLAEKVMVSEDIGQDKCLLCAVGRM